ncbi:DNA-3-methyladenine glycosylase 2 family protein [Mucilaginibacter corticis]|uniref:DNA-3-methyladenine glycosylase II n=1 Tax=Mucilaginibacter corticis TaxID=2597670 RepID=A0A556MW14_9SPHI|nr:DNA-3-methyladenine glycosylase [Mucilaginibacter corticis]TSJ43989.1 DNA-3-methyladenine glycosylase 2 family protein [Mucilaginibacter corticis]
MNSAYYLRLSADPLLAKLFENSIPYELKEKANIPLALYTSIMNQQLSTKVADVIYKRFINIYGGLEPTPQQVIDTPVEQFRAIGLSAAKAGYIKNVAQFAIDQGLDLEQLKAMNDDDIYKYVGTIKGVGKWTIHILLMFSLGREDIFIPDDLGIQNAMAMLFGLDKTDRKKLRADIITLSEQWSPYRTYLCVHLWQWINQQQSTKTTG